MKNLLNTKLKDMKAITLIALVITIVVLIILAGVIISITLGNNGIFNRVKTAKQEYANATQYEEEQIAKVSNEIDGYVGGGRDYKVNYSKTAEQEVGTWIDGKTIYGKVIDLGTSFKINSGWTVLPTDKMPNNINMPIKGMFYIVDTTTNDILCNPCECGYHNNVLKALALDHWDAVDTHNIYLYIEYTKKSN